MFHEFVVSLVGDVILSNRGRKVDAVVQVSTPEDVVMGIKRLALFSEGRLNFNDLLYLPSSISFSCLLTPPSLSNLNTKTHSWERDSLEDIGIVLVPFHHLRLMGSKVRTHETQRCRVEKEADGHTSFVTGCSGHTSFH